MAARPNEVGRCRCPVCGSGRARLRVSEKQLAYIVCDACQSQCFSRSDRSDELMRRMHIPDEAAAAPAPAPEPATAPVPAPRPTPAPEPATTEGPGWGFSAWTR